MHAKRLLPALIAVLVSAGHAQTAGLSTQHDGAWRVHLVCPDTRDKVGVVKGYEHEFAAQVAGGKLTAQHRTPGEPGSVGFNGVVREGGQLEIAVQGVTGDPRYSVDKVSKGTPYRYTLAGTLGATSGQADRRELRPCTATFTRQ